MVNKGKRAGGTQKVVRTEKPGNGQASVQDESASDAPERPAGPTEGRCWRGHEVVCCKLCPSRAGERMGSLRAPCLERRNQRRNERQVKK